MRGRVAGIVIHAHQTCFHCPVWKPGSSIVLFLSSIHLQWKTPGNLDVSFLQHRFQQSRMRMTETSVMLSVWEPTRSIVLSFIHLQWKIPHSLKILFSGFSNSNEDDRDVVLSSIVQRGSLVVVFSHPFICK